MAAQKFWDEYDGDAPMWSVEVGLDASGTHDLGAVDAWSKLVLRDNGGSILGRFGDADMLLVPRPTDGRSFFDVADEVSVEGQRAADFAMERVEEDFLPGMLLINSVKLDESARGFGLGRFLVAKAVKALTAYATDTLVVLEPGPFWVEDMPAEQSRAAVKRIAANWALLGFVFDEEDPKKNFMSVLADDMTDVDPFPPVAKALGAGDA